MMSDTNRPPIPPPPTPAPQPESSFYWEKCKVNELWLRHCIDCQQAYFYPRDICPHCFSKNTDWIQSSGRGTLYSFAIVHRAPSPAFREAVPYVVGLVDLEERVRIPTNIVEVNEDPSDLYCGMQLEVAFRRLNQDISLPVFRPLSTTKPK